VKQTEQMKKIRERMLPGAITAHGFLGADGRGVAEITEEDDGRVRRLGLTHERIAQRMRELRSAGEAGLGEFVDVAPHFRVRSESVRGKLPCPFADQCLTQKGFTTVRNAARDAEITFTDLHVHMIEAHGFYQGKGSRFRLEPEDLVTVLEITPPPGNA
jgi:hypothetical protein